MRTRTPGDGPRCWCGAPATFGGSCSAHFNSDTGVHASPEAAAPEEQCSCSFGDFDDRGRCTRCGLQVVQIPNELEQAKCLDVCPGVHDPCQLPKGHRCKHCNGLIEWLDPCMVCRSREGVRRFAVTVDGEELRMFALLCAAHGDQHLLNVGRVLGELFRPKG